MNRLQPLSEVFLYASPENAYVHVRLGNIQLHWRAGVHRCAKRVLNKTLSKEPGHEKTSAK